VVAPDDAVLEVLVRPAGSAEDRAGVVGEGAVDDVHAVVVERLVVDVADAVPGHAVEQRVGHDGVAALAENRRAVAAGDVAAELPVEDLELRGARGGAAGPEDRPALEARAVVAEGAVGERGTAEVGIDRAAAVAVVAVHEAAVAELRR